MLNTGNSDLCKSRFDVAVAAASAGKSDFRRGGFVYTSVPAAQLPGIRFSAYAQEALLCERTGGR